MTGVFELLYTLYDDSMTIDKLEIRQVVPYNYYTLYDDSMTIDK